MIVVPLVGLTGLAAFAAPPELHPYQAFAVAGWPSGVLSDTQLSARFPLHPEATSLLLQDTNLDLGGRVSLSPAFLEVGPKIAFQPVAVFGVTVQATAIRYISPRFGAMAYDEPDGTLGADRAEHWRAGDGFTGWGRTLQVNPVARGKVGPIVFLTSWNVSWVHVDKPEGVDSPYVFEPYRGMVIEWDDFTVEHLSGVLYEVMDADDPALVRLGGALRGRYAVRAPDVVLSAGFVGMFDPVGKPSVPSLTAIVLPYVVDPERVGRAPFAAVVLEWGN